MILENKNDLIPLLNYKKIINVVHYTVMVKNCFFFIIYENFPILFWKNKRILFGLTQLKKFPNIFIIVRNEIFFRSWIFFPLHINSTDIHVCYKYRINEDHQFVCTLDFSMYWMNIFVYDLYKATWYLLYTKEFM